MKKFFATLAAGVLLLGGVFTLAACADDNKPDNEPDNNPTTPTTTQLTAPTATLQNGIISWGAVEHATGYNVLEGTTVVSSAQTALSYTITKTEAGTYYYTVVALSSDSNYTASNASNRIEYTVVLIPPTPTQLAAPEITLVDNVISWTAVENATGYNVLEGTTVVSTAQTELSYTIDRTEAGVYNFTVVAVSSDESYTASNASNSVDYTVQAAPTELAAPVITITDKVISWTAVEHATGYNVLEGATVVSSAQTELSYTIDKTEAGTYNYTVVAVSSDENYTTSPASNSVEYTVQSAPVELTETTVYLVGDSTVCSFKDTYYIPRYGYGTQLGNYLDSKATINNLALSGRSSYSFLSETNYTTLKTSIKAGDYLIIGFGHNDQKDDIYSDPNLPYTDSTTLINGRPVSFAYNLYNYYIKVAKDAGATPILCTPIVRADSTNSYTNAKAHITDKGPAGFNGGDYAKAIRDLGAATQTTVIDLTAITKADYIAKGYDKALDYHAFTKAVWENGEGSAKIPTGKDETHTNLYGAKMNAYYIATELAKSDNTLGFYVKDDIAKPTYEKDYAAAINDDYTIVNYTSFDPANKSNKYNITADGWYGSAFGSISLTKVEIKQNAEDSFTIGTTGGSGKITSSGDGIACVFKQLGQNANFKLTATVTIDNYNSHKQSGFGIMLRDDMFIDDKDSIPTSNYVVAGCYGLKESAVINFYREDNALKNSTNTANLDTTTTHTLSIERSGTTITAKFDNYTYTSVADFDLRGVDSDYMYLCLFSTRDTKVTFSDIVFTDNGTAEA